MGAAPLRRSCSPLARMAGTAESSPGRFSFSSGTFGALSAPCSPSPMVIPATPLSTSSIALCGTLSDRSLCQATTRALKRIVVSSTEPGKRGLPYAASYEK